MDLEREQRDRPVARSRPGRHGVLDREVDELAGGLLGRERAFVLIALRSWRLSASIALVSGMSPLRVPGRLASVGRVIGASGGTRLGRPVYTLSCELALVRGRPCDWLDCAASANPFLSFRPAVLLQTTGERRPTCGRSGWTCIARSRRLRRTSAASWRVSSGSGCVRRSFGRGRRRSIRLTTSRWGDDQLRRDRDAACAAGAQGGGLEPA